MKSRRSTRAGILVAAIGKPKFVDESYVKEGADFCHYSCAGRCGTYDHSDADEQLRAVVGVDEQIILPGAGLW